MVWLAEGDEVYSVRSLCKDVENNMSYQCGAEKLVWKGIAPPKIKCFDWLALQQRIATRHLLWSWGILPPGTSILCPLCSDHVETIDHLLLHCEFAWRIGFSCLNWWGVSWVPPPTISYQWFDFNFKNLKKHIWVSLFFAIVWNICLCRNKKAFWRFKLLLVSGCGVM